MNSTMNRLLPRCRSGLVICVSLKTILDIEEAPRSHSSSCNSVQHVNLARFVQHGVPNSAY
jgi:hypothetical protein